MKIIDIVCSLINIGLICVGINMDVVKLVGEMIK